ncbi:MAG: peroxiredoxin-like family protein [Bacteriovoracia bacterium]
MRWFLLLLCISFTAHSMTPEERKKLFADATQKLKETKIAERAPRVGESVPDIKLGEKKVSEWLKTGPLIVTFYRGSWCPYCMKQLKEIQADLKSVKGAQIVAISPDPALEVKKTKQKNSLSFDLVSDPTNDAARLLGIAFQVDAKVLEEYKALGLNLSTNILPLPATFVVGKDSKIYYSFAHADYTQRAEWKDVVRAVKLVVAPQ